LFIAFGVLKSPPSHMITISSEETKLSLKSSRKCELIEETCPSIPEDGLSHHTYSKTSITDSGKH
jgi:hypothetical protein